MCLRYSSLRDRLTVLGLIIARARLSVLAVVCFAVLEEDEEEEGDDGGASPGPGSGSPVRLLTRVSSGNVRVTDGLFGAVAAG